MKKIIFMMCAILATTMMAKAEDPVCTQTEITELQCGDENVKVKLTAYPEANKYLTGWTLDGQPITVGADGTYIIPKITGNMEFVATFADQIALTVSCTNGKISINGEEKATGTYYYNPNTEITLTIVPTSDCYQFEKWQKDGSDITSGAELAKFTLTQNVSYSAYYKLIEYKATAAPATAGTGKVCIEKVED